MRPLALLAALIAVAAAAVAQPAPAGARMAFARPLGDGPVYRVEVAGPIDAALARYVERALADAEAAGASLVLLDVNTFGGLIDAADQIRTALLDAETPTVAYVNRNAASAGALIAYAADRIAMAPGASIGAATAVDAAGTYATEKVQSYVRSLMRATAEANGRDPRIAEAMVDERIDLPGVKEAGRLLSLSAGEAVRLGVAEAELPSEAAVLAAVGASERPVVAHAATRAERVLRFLGTPAVASLLLLMLMGGLYFELHAPGVGFPGAIALVGAALFFAPHYLLGLVESWEIAVFGLGVLLILAEVFVVPGFGVLGVSGIVLVVGSLVAALVGNVGLDFPGADALARATATLAAALVLTILLAFSLGRYLPRSSRFQRLVLADVLAGGAGYTAAATDDALVGQRGHALSPLRPAGTADIAGRRVDVVSEGGYVDPGAAVEVVRVRGARVDVRPVEA
jgi:membrane-bound serine protease (ClpP class)